jgi:hypothetical protein
LTPLIGAKMPHAAACAFFKLLIALKTSRLAQAVLTAQSMLPGVP